MSTTGTSFRRGTSTILGTLIFVGIMFTAVIPMLLVMRQADTLHEMRKHEITRADDERDRENIEVYPTPSMTEEEEMNVTLINTGGVSAEVVGIWINDTYCPVSEQISTFSSHEVGPFPAARVEGVEYEVRATSTRGNVYTSEIGILRYEGDKWISEKLGFNLIFPSRPSKNKRTNGWLNELKITIEQYGDILYVNSTMYWAISASEKFFQLDEAGAYNITVYIWCQTQHWDNIYEFEHRIDWPAGDPIIELNFVIPLYPEDDHLEVLD